MPLLLASFGCHMPEYQTFIDQQKMFASTGDSSSGTTDGTETGTDTGTTAAGSTGPGPDMGDSTALTSTGIDDGETTLSTSSTGSTAGEGSSTGSAAFCGDGVINQDFEECDVPSPDPEGPCTATCRRSRIIFALSIQLQGNMNGLQGADAYCKSQAVKAKKADPFSPLQGASTFKALLSTSKETVFERHYQGEGPYRLVNGLTVSDSFAALFSEPLQNSINVDEFGHTQDGAVWTGTAVDGSPYPGIDFCGDWTDNKGSSNWGVSQLIDMWIDAGDEVINNPDTDCYSENAVYCVEQE